MTKTVNGIKDFKTLIVWQKAKELTIRICRVQEVSLP